MSWNYRVVYHKAGKIENNPKMSWESYLAIHEAYYEDAEQKKIRNITQEPISIIGDEGKDSLISIKWNLEKIAEALEKPIIGFDTLEEIDEEKQKEFNFNLDTTK